MSRGRGTEGTRLQIVRRRRRDVVPDHHPTILLVVAESQELAVLAPVLYTLAKRAVARQLLVHAGPRGALASDLVADLPDGTDVVHLAVQRGSDAEETARVLVPFEHLLSRVQPTAVAVTGDAAATLACALTATKHAVGVARLDAGLRCRDWSRPEEVNRALLDRLADTLLVHDDEARQTLLQEGLPRERIYLTGNTLADSVRRWEPRARELRAWERHGLSEGRYVLVVLRPGGWSSAPGHLSATSSALGDLARSVAVVVITGTGTAKRVGRFARRRGLRTVAPATYAERLALTLGAGAVITDSGPVQDEASILGVACHTLGPHTERLATLTHGTNALLGEDASALVRVRPRPRPRGALPSDGRDANTGAGARAADVLITQHVLHRAAWQAAR